MPTKATAISLCLESVFRVSTEQVSTCLPGNDGQVVIILGLKDGYYFELSEVGARIWSLLQSPASLNSVLESLMAEYDVARSRCETDLMNLIEQLLDRGLVEAIDTKATEVP
ncbi:MAG: PqqD family protein [Thermomicrobiales bacterium]|nr:MAG: PqqD family protein [Thermomicrobiales bacterium]